MNNVINIHITGPAGTGKTVLTKIIRNALLAASTAPAEATAKYLSGKTITFTESDILEIVNPLTIP